MNQLYKTFKENNKGIKSKNKKFIDFYNSNKTKNDNFNPNNQEHNQVIPTKGKDLSKIIKNPEIKILDVVNLLNDNW